MSEFTKRLIFGILYVLIIILATCTNMYFFSGIFFIFLMFCTYEFNRILKLKTKYSYLLNSFIFISFIIRDFNLDYYFIHPSYNLFKISVVILVLLLALLFIMILSKGKTLIEQLSKVFLSFIYIGLPFAFLFDIEGFETVKINMVLCVFVLLWSNDTFAYIVGKSFGKHKLLERISPKKTIEGFIGGLIFTLIVGYIIATLNANLAIIHWLIIALIVSIFGTIGDLIESKFKREVNIKDSSNLIPGHGGFLDRLDSFIFAIPFIFVYLSLIQPYVS